MHHPFATLFALSAVLLAPASVRAQVQDYFKQHQGALEIKMEYNSGTLKTVNLTGVDGATGDIKLSTGQVSLPKKLTADFLRRWWRTNATAKKRFPRFPEEEGQEARALRSLYRQTNPGLVKSIRYEWSDQMQKILKYLDNEQYSEKLIAAARPIMYRIMPFHEIPNDRFAIHDQILSFVTALVEMEQYREAYTVLSRLNLKKLDDFGYREFSDLALILVGKMTSSDPRWAQWGLALLAKVDIRPQNGSDHEALMKLADTLRKQGQFGHAKSVYARLGPIVQALPGSPLKKLVKLWPIYCNVKLYELNPADSRPILAAAQLIGAIDKAPPPRQSNEYSLYKLIRALIRNQYAKAYETKGQAEQAKDFRRQAVLEVTDGIVSSRVGLDWLPESLLMVGAVYEELASGEKATDEKSATRKQALVEAARNVYKQVKIFYKGSAWATESDKRLSALPNA